jgi:hypothetical protein
MRRARERGPWARLRSAAVAASVLGMVGPSLAQAPRLVPVSNSGPTDNAIVGSVTEFNIVSEADARLEELKVELAWLAEPSSFSCQLQAKADGPSLIVRGFVPNQTVRDLALKAAREHTFLNVADGITLQSNLVLRSGGKEAGAVQKQALEVLTQHFPQQAKTFRVTAKVSGEVTVTGTVPTFEDRVAVSRKLRLVDGCTCVVNQVQVPSVLRDGVKHFVVTSDGRLVVQASKMVDSLDGRTAPRTVAKSAGTIQQVTYTTTTENIPAAPRAPAKSPPSPFGGAAQPPATTAKIAPEPVPASTPLPLAPVPKGETAKAPVPDPDGGYVTTGVILVGTDNPPPPAPAATPPSADTLIASPGDVSPAKLKKRIEAVCGKAVQDVEVVPRAPGSVLVRMKVRTSEDGKRASEKILALPEVAPPFQVQIHAAVEP